MIIELEWKKRICILTALLAAGILTAYAGIRREQKMQKELAGNVLRFHVIANSNSKRDQELKLRVKEQIIQYMKEEIPTSDSVEQTRRWAKTHLIEIEDRAKEFLRVQGCNLPVKACVADSYFPEKRMEILHFHREIMRHFALKLVRQTVKIGGVCYIQIYVLSMQCTR